MITEPIAYVQGNKKTPAMLTEVWKNSFEQKYRGSDTSKIWEGNSISERTIEQRK